MFKDNTESLLIKIKQKLEKEQSYIIFKKKHLDAIKYIQKKPDLGEDKYCSFSLICGV